VWRVLEFESSCVVVDSLLILLEREGAFSVFDCFLDRELRFLFCCSPAFL